MTRFFPYNIYTKTQAMINKYKSRGESTVIIYLDILILINLYCNFMIIILMKLIARVNVPLYKMIIGTIVATAIVPLTIFFPQSIITTAIGKIMYSFFIIFAIFGYKSIVQFIKCLSIFYFISFGVGGGLLAFHFLITDSFFQSNDLLMDTAVNSVLVIIGLPLLLLFTKKRLDHHVIEKIQYDQLYKVIVHFAETQVETVGFMDSGNHLTDPITNRPVIICEASFIAQFFNSEDWQIIKNMLMKNDITHIPHRFKKVISIIPYQVIGKQHNFLYAFKLDKLQIHVNGKILETKQLLIGIQWNRLSADKTYTCLLHPQIIHHATAVTA